MELKEFKDYGLIYFKKPISIYRGSFFDFENNNKEKHISERCLGTSSNSHNLNSKHLSDAINLIIKYFDSFDKLVKLCGGIGYKFHKDLYFKDDIYFYNIHLYPVKDEWNYYIKIYDLEQLYN